MKLSTLKDGTRDGLLVVVDKDLQRYVAATGVAKTLQAALDTWETSKPALEKLSHAINAQEITGQPLLLKDLRSPLPRAYQWADGSAYVTHVELVRKARGATMPERFWTDPLMYQGGSDAFLDPTQDIPLTDAAWGLDFEAEVAIITTDVPMGITADKAGKHIALCMLVNDVSLRNLIPGELEKGFGFFQSKPASSFSPIAVTPDELGAAWDGARLNLPIISTLNGVEFGHPNCATDMTFSFPELIAHAAKSRTLSAGTIIGSGTVSNQDAATGSSCIAEKRMRETLATGKPITPFMQVGDSIRIEILDAQGKSIFGAIDQKVVPYANPL